MKCGGAWDGSNSLSPPGTSLWQSSFPWRLGLCYGKVSGLISQWLFFSFLCQRPEGIFLDLHHKNLAVFSELKSIKFWGALRLCLLRAFQFQVSPHMSSNYLSKLAFTCFYQVLVPAASPEVSRPQPCLIHSKFLFLQILGWQFALQVQFSDGPK